jgi:hypothetical protein
MLNIAAWIARISWPLVTKILVSLGIGTVTYAGAGMALTGVLNAAKSSFSMLGGNILNYLSLAGVWDAFSIISGALVSSLSFMALKRFTLQTGS